jgi:hypothetical protein
VPCGVTGLLVLINWQLDDIADDDEEETKPSATSDEVASNLICNNFHSDVFV